MREMTMKKAISQVAHILAPIVLVFSLSATAFAAAPGITGPSFNLTAQQAYLNQPDGEAVYSWGYGCNGTPAGFAPTLNGQTCPTMQVPGSTLIVHENAVVTVTLLNGLPNAAGNTSILFPGFNVPTTCPASTAAGAPQQGLLTCEAAPGGTVTYTFTASAPGTHAYYSGTQGDLQIEMGLYGAVIVLPASVPANCTTGYHAANLAAALFGHAGRGRLFEHFLMAPLHRAVAFKERQTAALPVGEHLDLDMPGALEVFFQEHALVTESRQGFAPACGERRVEFRLVLDRAHAFAAAAGRSLD